MAYIILVSTNINEKNNEQENNYYYPVLPRCNGGAGASEDRPRPLSEGRGDRRMAYRTVRRLCHIRQRILELCRSGQRPRGAYQGRTAQGDTVEEERCHH